MQIKRKKFLIIAGVLGIILVAFSSYKLFIEKKRVGFVLSDRQVERYADKVIDECKGDSYRPRCYEKEIPKLMDEISLEDAFRVTRLVQEKDSSFAYCHVLAHNLSYEEASRSPSEWQDIITRCPFTMCNYGCLHGSLIQHYRGEVLTESQIEEAVETMKDVCEPREGWNPAEIDRTMCYHAMGHLAMYITGGDPDQSNEVCKKISIKPDGRDYYEVCVEGVFMTIYQGVDEEDIALVREIKPEKDEVRQFCRKYQGVEYEACNRESYPLFKEEVRDPEKLSDFCSYSRTEHGMTKCYGTAIGDVVVDKLERDSINEMVDYCLNLRERNAQCFAHVATRMIQIEPSYSDDAIEFCKKAEENGYEEECFRDIANYSRFSFRLDSDKRVEYCSKLPEDWKKVCLRDENY